MIQLERVGESLAVMAAGRQALPAEARNDPELGLAASVEIIRQMFKQFPFRGRRVVAALPRQSVHFKNLRLPQMPLSELGSVVEFEARNLVPFDPAEATIHFLPAGEVRQNNEIRQEVIVVGARHVDINHYVEHLHAAGTVVAALDVEPCALYRGIERFIRRREDETEVHVIVDVGASRTLVVIGRGREISFTKTIELGGRHFNEAVSKKLGISVEEAQSLRRRLAENSTAGVSAAPIPGEVAPAARRDPVRQAAGDATRSVMSDLGREVALCMRYYSVTFRGQRPSRLRLVGSEAADPLLHGLLSATIPVPIDVGRPLVSVDTSRMRPADRQGPMSEWAMAFGLSLKLLTGSFGARDGRPRDPSAPLPVEALLPADAEVGESTPAPEHAIIRTTPADGVTDPSLEVTHA